MNQMQTEAQIRDKLRKIKSLFEGAASDGERQAAQAAIDRLQQRIAGITPEDPVTEYRFSLGNAWSLRLFLALCRSKGLRPYRYRRMRHTSVCVKIGKRALDQGLWPEYLEMDKVLTAYLGQLADHIIAECIDPDQSDAALVQGIAGPGAEMTAG